MGNLSVDKLESPGQRSVVSVYLRRPYHRVCISAKGSQAQKPNARRQRRMTSGRRSNRKKAYAVTRPLNALVRPAALGYHCESFENSQCCPYLALWGTLWLL